MPNKNRQAGDYFERRTRDALRDDGWIVIRAAGSLGPADLVALKDNRVPRLISCKVHGALPRKEAMALIETAEQAGAWAILATREKPGWAHLSRILRRFGTEGTDRVPLISLHMPARRVAGQESPDGLMPAGVQMALPVDIEG